MNRTALFLAAAGVFALIALVVGMPRPSANRGIAPAVGRVEPARHGE